MPRRHQRSIDTLALVVAVCALELRPTFAGDPPKPTGGNTATAPAGAAGSAPAVEPAPSAAETKSEKPAGPPKLPGQLRFGAKLTGRNSQQYRYLADMIDSQTTLPAEDRAMIRRRLEHYAGRMEAGMIEGSDVYDGPDESDADVQAMSGPSADARPNARRGGVKNKMQASPLGTDAPLFKDIAGSLNAEPRKQFEAVALRWTRLKFRGGPDGPLSRLMRALRDPLLQLSEEKAESLRKTVGETMASVKASRKDPEVVALAEKEVRQRVDSELTPDQIKHLDGTLAEIATQQEAEVANGKKLEQRWKDESVPVPVTTERKPRPNTPKPASSEPKPTP